MREREGGGGSARARAPTRPSHDPPPTLLPSITSFPNAAEHVLCNVARGLVCGRTLLAAACATRLDAFVACNAHAMADPAYLATWAGLGGAGALADAFESVLGFLFDRYGLAAATAWALARLAPALDPATLGLDHNYKSLLALTAGEAGVEYSARHRHAAAWGGLSPGAPVAAGAASLPSAADPSTPRDAWIWVCECRVAGERVGIGADLHRATAEQAAARAALAALGVDAEGLWRARVADQLVEGGEGRGGAAGAVAAA